MGAMRTEENVGARRATSLSLPTLNKTSESTINPPITGYLRA